MKATFAAGCFWSVEELFRQQPGVISTRVGYIGGHTINPTYQSVCADQTGHAEAVEVEYDPEKITYKNLLKLFWNNHNPTTLNQQGPDIGAQYRSAIFFHNAEQEREAYQSKELLEQDHVFSKPIVTQILPAAIFYPAEDYHQQYLVKQGKTHCNNK
jgi:peptide-methionine (S)-S-oxide reductase